MNKYYKLRHRLLPRDGKQVESISNILQEMYDELSKVVLSDNGIMFDSSFIIEVDDDTYRLLSRKCTDKITRTYFLEPYQYVYAINFNGIEISDANYLEHEIIMTYKSNTNEYEKEMIYMPNKSFDEKLLTPWVLWDDKLLSKKIPTIKIPTIKKVIFNNPATIVLWSDNTKTVVMCGEDDMWDEEKGLAMAIAKKTIGLKNFYKHYNTAVDKMQKKIIESEKADESLSD